MKNWLARNRVWVISGIIGIAIIAIGWAISWYEDFWLCRAILSFFKDWSIALSAGAAVILAVAAFRAIKISSEQKQLLTNQTEFLNEQIRFLKQERLLKILDDVCAWANDMTNFRLEWKDEFSKAGTSPNGEITHSVLYWTTALNVKETSGKSLKRQSEKIWGDIGLVIGNVLINIAELKRFLLFEFKDMEQYTLALEKARDIATSAETLSEIVDKIKSSVLSQ